MSKPVEAGSLKVGHYIVIDNEPCRIVEFSKSKPGKHGAAKVRIVAIGVFDGVKRTLICPADAQVMVPIIEKRTGQIVAVMPETVQVMDLETYEVLEMPLPSEIPREKLVVGAEVEYWKALGKTHLMKVKGA